MLKMLIDNFKEKLKTVEIENEENKSVIASLREVFANLKNEFIKVVLGNSSQKVALVGVFVEAQQNIQRADSLLEVALHHLLATYIEEVVTIVLRHSNLCHSNHSNQKNYYSTHIFPNDSNAPNDPN